MSNSQRILTERFKHTMVNLLIDDINSGNNYYYIFAGHSIPWANGDTIPATPSDDNHDSVIDIYQNMSFGKLLNGNNVITMIPRYDWISNTIFSMYNDQDPNLFNENFYAVVNSVSTYDIWKCLYNNNGNPSLVAPIASDVNPSEFLYQTSDGYIWLWLYSIDLLTFQKYATSSFIPVIPNANVTGNAVAGAIDIIIPTVSSNGSLQVGSGYGNYFEGQFIISDIQVGGNTLLYGIGANASTTNNFYNQCLMYISDGTGKGQFSQILSYRVVGTIKEVFLTNVFSVTPDTTSSYQIYPYVQVVGDDNVSVNCIARALINAYSSNSVYSVQVIQRGAGYRVASATILSDATVGVTNTANLQVIIPPPGGHGFDIYNELGGVNLGISLQFSNNESNTIPTQNGFRQVGIIKNPLFANVQLNLTDTNGNPGTNGNFNFGETVTQFTPVLLAGNVSVNASCTVITGTGTTFQNQLEPNDMIYISAGTGQVLLATVNSITNNTILTIDTNCLFTNTSCQLALVEPIANGVIIDISPSSINLTNVFGLFVTNEYIVGETSFSKANVTSFLINDINKGFDTFVQLRRYLGTVSGDFIEGELVYQISANTSNASFFAINAASGGQYNFYVSNQVGIFTTAYPIVGSNSGATFSIASAYPGDLVLDSGRVLYYENDPAIERSDNENEVVNIVLEYS